MIDADAAESTPGPSQSSIQTSSTKQSEITRSRLSELIPGSGFAFRGFDQTNLGKTPILLGHSVYGPFIEKHLTEGSKLASEVLNRKVDLVRRVRERRETTLEEYGEAIAMIVAVELAHIEILRTVFQVEFSKSQLAFGYSLGEIGALIATGVYDFEALLTPLIALSEDLVELAHDTRMAIVFSRRASLDVESIKRLCLEVTMRGQGTIAISSYLSPNTVLVLGQQGSVNELRKLVRDRFPKGTIVKEHQHLWPPIHTPITRQKSIPDRAAVILERMAGGLTIPNPLLVSCVTGGSHYTDINSRELLNRWVDEPQRLWDVIDCVISSGVELIVHVGPHPNLIPATLERLKQNVQQQLDSKTWTGMGLRAVSQIVRRRRPWLSQILTSQTNLLRAPFIQEIILEDWLLAQM